MVRIWVGVALGLVPAQPPGVQPPPNPAAALPAAPTKLTPDKPIEWPQQIGGKSISYFIAEMASPDPTRRWEAMRTLPYFGPVAARGAGKQLLAALDDPDPGVRVNAILTLAMVGFDNRADIPKAAAALRASVKNTAPGSVVRLHAAKCLGAMGTDAYVALDALVALVTDPAWETRDATAAALGRVGMAVYEPAAAGKPPQIKRPASPTARAQLNLLLKDASSAVRSEAIQALLTLGPPTPKDPADYEKEAQPHIDAVLARLAPGTDKAPGEKDPSLRLWLHTLALMYDDRHAPVAVKELTAAVTSADRAVRVQGLLALQTLGPPISPRALDEVRDALHAPEGEVSRAAVMCVLKMGTDGRKAFPDLLQVAASTTDKELKELIEQAVKMMAPGAVPAAGK